MQLFIFLFGIFLFLSFTHCNCNTEIPIPISTSPDSRFPNFSSDLLFAIKLTTLARNTMPRTFISQTWIFGWWANNSSSNARKIHEDQFSSTYSSASAFDLLPMVIIPCFGNEETKTNFSYSREFALSDLINPTRLGVLRLVTNYFSAFISIPNENIQIPGDITTALIVRKFARPHLDYFYYIGKSPDIDALFATFQLSDMRYRFGLILPAPTDQRPFIKLRNPCQKNGETNLRLFSRRCDTIIADRHYHITACKVESMVRYENYLNGSLKWGRGSVVAMFLEASRRHNFTFDIRYAHYDGASGFKENGVWKGAVGEVLSRESDIAFAVGVTVSRLPIIDPSIAQTRISRVFYIRTPACRTSWKAIFWPLKYQVWILTFMSVICFVLPIYYVSAVVYFKQEAGKSQGKFQPPPYILLEMLDVIFRILMDQSTPVRRWKNTTLRFLIIIWAFFSIVLGTGYRSKLFSFLSFIEPDEIPQTHKELSLANEYKIYFRYMGGIAYLYYLNSKDPVHQRTLQRATLVNSSQECVTLALLEENAACLEYQVNGDFAIQGNMSLNPFMKASEVFATSKDKELSNIINWSFRKGSPWRESFDKVILFSLAAGLYEVWQAEDAYLSRVESSRWLNSQNDSIVKTKIEEVLTSLKKGPKAMNITNLKAVFFILGFGLGISALAWMGEKLKFYCEAKVIRKEVRKHLCRQVLSVKPRFRLVSPLETLEGSSCQVQGLQVQGEIHYLDKNW